MKSFVVTFADGIEIDADNLRSMILDSLGFPPWSDDKPERLIVSEIKDVLDRGDQST